MEKNSTRTTFGLKRERLIDLLNLGSDVGKVSRQAGQNEKKNDCLRDLLEGTLPVEVHVMGSLPPDLTNFADTIGAVCSPQIGTALLDPETNVALVRAAKDYAKQRSRNSASEAEHHSANTLYYAAVASALVFHNQRITRFAWAKLDSSFDRLAKEQWIPKDFTDLFVKAQRLCRDKNAERH